MYVSLFFRGYLVASDGFLVLAVDGEEEAAILIDWVENSSNHADGNRTFPVQSVYRSAGRHNIAFYGGGSTT